MVIALGALVLTAAACAPVLPHQRGRLAHPTMRIQIGAGPAESHLYAIHEGATGGAIGAEGGCGCN